MKDLIVENISYADDSYVETFYNEIKNLDKKLVKLINFFKFKIILADKISDVADSRHTSQKRYCEYKHIDNEDLYVRGLTNSCIKAVCVFHNNVEKEMIGTVLYHEIGHLLDFYRKTIKPKTVLSSDREFIKAYKKDLGTFWKEIREDKSFRLIHYIQNSNEKYPNTLAMAEVFASCFSKFNGKYFKEDFISKYFLNSYKISKKLIKKGLKKL